MLVTCFFMLLAVLHSFMLNFVGFTKLHIKVNCRVIIDRPLKHFDLKLHWSLNKYGKIVCVAKKVPIPFQI